MEPDEIRRVAKLIPASRMAAAVMRDRYNRGWSMPSYTPEGWWECDVFHLSDAGYYTEFEIKRSRADFKKDAAKMRPSYSVVGGLWGTGETKNKHDMIVERSTKGPTQFYFVTPIGILTLEDIPEWAGWMEVIPRSNCKCPSLVVVERKRAPRLHGEKFAEADKPNYKRTTAYWRLHTAMWNQAREGWRDHSEFEDGLGI